MACSPMPGSKGYDRLRLDAMDAQPVQRTHIHSQRAARSDYSSSN